MDVEERVDRLLEPELSCLVRVRAEGAGAPNVVLYSRCPGRARSNCTRHELSDALASAPAPPWRATTATRHSPDPRQKEPPPTLRNLQRPRHCSRGHRWRPPRLPSPPRPQPSMQLLILPLSLPTGRASAASRDRKNAGSPVTVFPRRRELQWRGGGGTTLRGSGGHVSVGRGWGDTSRPRR